MDTLLKTVLLALAFIQGLDCRGAPDKNNSIQGPSTPGQSELGPAPVKPVASGAPVPEPEPFMASLRNKDGNHFCGGSLIHPKVVLTAAHCLPAGLKPDVHLGRAKRKGKYPQFDSEKHTTRAAIPHESYKNGSSDYDIAVLVLDSESDRELLPLADSADCFEDKDGCTVQLLGWGTTSYRGKPVDYLYTANTISIGRRKCMRLLGQDRVTKRMICGGEIEIDGKDACQGDSGGPMIQDKEQVGIVSFGEGCASGQSPGFYTSVPELRQWINFRLFLVDSDLPLNTDPCQCAKDGVSDGVSTGRLGCKQHLVDCGDTDFFCMTIGGMACPVAKPSETFAGAAWIDCD